MAAAVYSLAEAGLPDGLPLGVIGKGRVRHLISTDTNETFCDMYVDTVWNETNKLRPAGDDDADKALCGGCLRSLPARKIKLAMDA